jgi:predicted DNA-binding transcriptional regulator AlpA
MGFEFLQQVARDNAAAEAARAKAEAKPAKPVKKATPVFDLSQPGRLRAAQVRQILGVSQSTFYDGLKKGRFPAASGKDGAMVYWDTEVIREFLATKDTL